MLLNMQKMWDLFCFLISFQRFKSDFPNQPPNCIISLNKNLKGLKLLHPHLHLWVAVCKWCPWRAAQLYSSGFPTMPPPLLHLLLHHTPHHTPYPMPPLPSFLGDIGHIKVVLEFSLGHPKCHFWARKDGHFCQRCPYLGRKN